MSLVRNIRTALRGTLAYKSPISWTRLLSSTPTPVKPESSKPISEGSDTGVRAIHKPDNLEKKFLVWTGKYKSVEEVPEYVSPQVMERTRNKIRIKVANIMVCLTILGCIGAIYSGKKAAESGESVEKMNLDWHKKYNEDAAKSASK
ncbi:UPF0389 protein [Pseudolycoriella hygida]|uniref:UPF0389 protein n=1 Tax=Pseudolycoriella hygida TaxID=35572 RepID=A0A9Q0MZU2_9DIPT|nr:UPF0389 protein [Pseudolycoriella hygida]